MLRRIGLVAVLFLAACDSLDPPLKRGSEVTLSVLDTLISVEDTVVSQPSELTIDDRGLVYVTDFGSSRVAVLDSLGNPLRLIGREGSGPGEFRWPRSVTVHHDTMRLVDSRNGRLQILTDTGRFIGTMPLPPGATSGAVSIAADGSLLVGMNGTDSLLARRYNPEGEPGIGLGRPVAPTADVWNFTEIKRQIGEGRVPDVLRNIVLPVLADDGAVWLGLMAEGVVEHYSPEDLLVWRITLTEPEFDTIRARFFELNAAESNPGRLHSLAYFVEGEAVGNDLWLLVRRQDEPMLMLVLGQDGVVRRRIRAPEAIGINGFALDLPRRRLYLLAAGEGTVLRADLPPALFQEERP